MLSKIDSIFLFGLVFTGLIISNSNYLKIRYGQQLFSQLFDNSQREQFIENNLYLKLYKSGFAIFKDNPIFGCIWAGLGCYISAFIVHNLIQLIS